MSDFPDDEREAEANMVQAMFDGHLPTRLWPEPHANDHDPFGHALLRFFKRVQMAINRENN